jgi:crotonobetainyl-CoA:carnitine CoA-transferase CaiB-like acyl-CoA transferase
MSERDGQAQDVLAGIRVLDFGRDIAGPYCAALLGDLGADVIRIERRGGSEDRWVAPVAPDGAGAMFLVMNRNKRAMTLDPAERRRHRSRWGRGGRIMKNRNAQGSGGARTTATSSSKRRGTS